MSAGQTVPPRPARNIALAFVLFLGGIFLVVGLGLALGLGPLPHSDWALYWTSAGDASAYERGGVGLWLLAVPRLLGFGPVGAALLLNLAAGLVVLGISWKMDRSRKHLLAILTATYLIMLAPYVGIVQLDMLAAAFVAAALACLSASATHPRPARLRAVAVGLLACAVSTKPQYALLAWALVVLLALPAWRWRRREPGSRAFLGVLLLGSLAGFAADNLMRAMSGKSDALRTSSAVTLYAGLLVSGTESCGYWSRDASQAARDDMDMPLPVAIGGRLAARPASHWLSVLGCKAPQVIRPPPFALYWLLEAPNVRAAMDSSPHSTWVEARYQRAMEAERRIYAVLTFRLVAGLFASALLAWRRGGRFLAMLPLAWLLSFWGVHLVFEIQGRYFLGLFLLAPLVSAVALGAASRRPPAEPVECRASPRTPPEPTR